MIYEHLLSLCFSHSIESSFMKLFIFQRNTTMKETSYNYRQVATDFEYLRRMRKQQVTNIQTSSINEYNRYFLIDMKPFWVCSPICTDKPPEEFTAY